MVFTRRRYRTYMMELSKHVFPTRKIIPHTTVLTGKWFNSVISLVQKCSIHDIREPIKNTKTFVIAMLTNVISLLNLVDIIWQ